MKDKQGRWEDAVLTTKNAKEEQEMSRKTRKGQVFLSIYLLMQYLLQI